MSFDEILLGARRWRRVGRPIAALIVALIGLAIVRDSAQMLLGAATQPVKTAACAAIVGGAVLLLSSAWICAVRHRPS